MNILQAVLLGIIQGLTEFLPISSSGHLVLAQAALGIQEPSLLLTVLLHVGTLIAVLAVFWRDCWIMLKNPIKSHLFWMLVLATLPAVAAALLLSDTADALFGDPSLRWLLGLFFLCTAVLLVLAERYGRGLQPRGRHAREQGMEQISPRQAGAMGAMQAAAAILPGLSRSGSTIVGGMLTGVQRSAATKFSFMMSIPAILGSLVFEAKDLLEGNALTGIGRVGGWLPPLVGVLTAAVCGYLAIRWMLRLVRRASLNWFALYTAVLGALVLLDHFFFHRFIA